MKAEMEAKATAHQEEAVARQAKAEAQANAHLERMKAIMRSIPSDIDRILQQKIEAWKKRYLSSEERTTICRVPPVACSDNSEGKVITSEESSEEMEATRLEATPEETEAVVITSEESSEEMEATNLEATPDETEAAVERQERFEKETNFDTIGSSEDRCEDRRLIVRRRRGPKKRSQDSVGSRQKSSAARKRVIHRAVPAVRKGQMRKGPGKDRTTRGALKRRRLEKIRRRGQECSVGLRNRGPKNQLHLGMRRSSSRAYRMPMQLEMANLIFGSTTEIQDVNDWTFWKVRPPSKRKKDLLTA
jgi:hypothetical protein